MRRNTLDPRQFIDKNAGQAAYGAGLPHEAATIEDDALLVCATKRPRPTFPRVICVKFCKRRSFLAGSAGSAELGFLVLLKIAHVEVSVGHEFVAR